MGFHKTHLNIAQSNKKNQNKQVIIIKFVARDTSRGYITVSCKREQMWIHIRRMVIFGFINLASHTADILPWILPTPAVVLLPPMAHCKRKTASGNKIHH